jgi:hypothetical protein
MIGTIIIKNQDIYIRYNQQQDGYLINVYDIEIDPRDKQEPLKDGQTVEFEMYYGQAPSGKNYAKIKR